MKTIVIGSSGQLGSDVVKAFGGDAIPLERGDIDIAEMGSCRKALKGAEAVINCAGFVRVDDCETSIEDAFASNAIGARNVAAVCKEQGMRNVYISTDFVFDGAKGSPYKETDIPRPINAYGISKYAGELFTQAYSGDYFILRCAGMFGVRGSSGKKGNFVEWMLKKSDSSEEIRVIDDVVTSFTYTVDVAGAIKQMLKIYVCEDITIHYKKRLCRFLLQQAQGSYSSHLLLFLHIRDLNTKRFTVPEIIPYHLGFIIYTENKPVEPAGRKIMNYCFKN